MDLMGNKGWVLGVKVLRNKKPHKLLFSCESLWELIVPLDECASGLINI
jgi:hypothetical protein